jgi:hypothetical protein
MEIILTEEEYGSMVVSLHQGHLAGYGGLYPKAYELKNGNYMIIPQ